LEHADEAERLSRRVQERVGDGWQPLGGPFSADGVLYQAVVWTEGASSRLVPRSSLEDSRETVEHAAILGAHGAELRRLVEDLFDELREDA
jgi:hypothetical protein